MKTVGVEKLGLKYRYKVDKFMSKYLQDDRYGYIKFVKLLPIPLSLLCVLAILYEIIFRYSFNMPKNEIIFYILMSLCFIAVCCLFASTLIKKFPRRYSILVSGVNKKWIESDEVTNAYFVKLESTGKIFSGKEVENVLLSLSTVYKDIKENEKNIFVISEEDNRICMVLNNMLGSEGSKDFITKYYK